MKRLAKILGMIALAAFSLLVLVWLLIWAFGYTQP